MVEQDIEGPALFERIEKWYGEWCGDSGIGMELEQYDEDIRDWVTVDADDVEPEDGSKFRVVRL